MVDKLQLAAIAEFSDKLKFVGHFFESPRLLPFGQIPAKILPIIWDDAMGPRLYAIYCTLEPR